MWVTVSTRTKDKGHVYFLPLEAVVTRPLGERYYADIAEHVGLDSVEISRDFHVCLSVCLASGRGEKDGVLHVPHVPRYLPIDIN